MYRKQQHKKRKKEGKKEKALSRTRAVLTELLTVKRKKSNVNAFHGNEWMKEHNYTLQNADTRPRLQSRTQNICLVISISAVILKLMVKITSIFGSYRFLRIAWHDIFSHSHRPLASWNLYIVRVAGRRANAHLLVKFNAWMSQRLLNSNPQLNHRTHLKDSCVS